MPGASHAVPSFLGGEISQFAQGRFDKPDYHISMRVCLNAFPGEIGPWMRRPGTAYAGHTRGGAKGRVIKFDFEQAAPITLEFTDGYVRFRSGTSLVMSSAPVAVVAVSTANPAVVQTASATTWATGDTLVFPGASTPLLENRQFVATQIDTEHFSLADALTGASINGASLGALVSGATVAKVHERTTPYINGTWENIRAVQCETTDVLLCPNVPPQALVATTLPSAGVSPGFTISPATFNDGPYLDPFTNGVQATPGATSGIVGITLAFPAYSSTTAYAKSSFVTSSSVNYESLVDQNVDNTPVSSPSFWAPVSTSAAINNGQGFLGTDIGRLVRLFSEPAPWLIGSTYAAGNVVSYNPSGEPGEATYWQSQKSSNTGNAPGSDLTNWTLMTTQGAAVWTWGKITSLTNIISRTSGSSIGNMTGGGGISSPFNGAFSQPAASSAELTTTLSLPGPGYPAGTQIVTTSFVGKNYTSPGAQIIQQATVYPSSDQGLSHPTATVAGTVYGNEMFGPITAVFNLRGSNSAPSSSSNGTLLATSGSVSAGTAVTLVSTDQTDTWDYVWVEQITTATYIFAGGSASQLTLTNIIGQLSFFNPPGTGTSSGVDIEILGPPLLYTNPVITWRLGTYSNTTGFPTDGCYDDGRLWLVGALSNHFDASTSNGIVPGSSEVNFAPTDQFGVVAASAGISETLNDESSNPIFWAQPDLQGILMGTQAAEYLVLAPTSGSIAPDNITSRRGTRIGSANIRPIKTEHTLLFVQRYARKLIEFFADVFSGKFTGPNLVDKAEHMVTAGIAEIAYTNSTTPLAWGRCNDGSWFGATYKRDTLMTAQGPTYAAFHRQQPGSGRLVESICAGPSVDGNLDALTMVTNDPTTNIRHVEVLTDSMTELSTLQETWFLDDAVNPTSTSTTSAASVGFPYGGLTINGLWHLNGKTVQVFAGGLDLGDWGPVQTYQGTTTYAQGVVVNYGGTIYVSQSNNNKNNTPSSSSTFWTANAYSDYTVSNGSITVPYGDGISWGPGRGLFTAAFAAALPLTQIVVGFTYNSDGQLVRPIQPAETGARNGPAFGKLSRHHRYAFRLVNTVGLSVGTSFTKLIPFNTKLNGNGAPLAPLNMFTGISADAFIDDYAYDNALCWRVSRPWPATVTAAGTSLETQDQ